ncbi:regulator of chromosome condensation [Drosophila grimshawi]|uniref:GH16887 n=1 Tax=Drosophila grimshawi TaxID=7222 RepID=B4IXC8_DROGR|nr:regulator of chromosome condensation [Drosophila grimshawi]EDV97460.1 GH16887 [Drosophila grimshawi]
MPRRKALANTNNDAAADKALQPTRAKRARTVFNLELPHRRQIIGDVLVCGAGDTGQLGLGEDVLERKRLALVEGIPRAVDVCAGGMHSLVLTNSGDIYSFGCNDEGALGRDTKEKGSESRPAIIELPGKALAISAGDSHSACLLEDGRVFAWGSFRDSHGNMGLTIDGNKRTPINLLEGSVCCSIASGADHLVILTTAGKAFTVGCAEQGQLGRISERSVNGEGRRGKQDLLRPDELIIKRTKPFEAIWATNYCTFVRESQTGIIWAVGLNNYKQLAHVKDIERVLTPIKTNLKDVKQIAGGQHHTLILDNAMRCLAVGRHNYGRLGLGDVKDVVSEPTAIKQLNGKAAFVGCGETVSFTITNDGKLYSWGMGTNLQLGVGDGDDEMEPVEVVSKNTQNKRMLLADGGGQHSVFLVEAAVQEAQKENVPATKKTEAKPAAAAAVGAAAADDKAETQNEDTVAADNDNDDQNNPTPSGATKPAKKMAAKRGRGKKN